jgi:hypothetical protein
MYDIIGGNSYGGYGMSTGYGDIIGQEGGEDVSWESIEQAISGADYAVGQDDFDFSALYGASAGAMPPAQNLPRGFQDMLRQAARAGAQAQARKMGPMHFRAPPPNVRTAMLREIPPREVREFPMPASSQVAVPPGSFLVNVFPQNPFKVKRLVVVSSVAPSFTIEDIKVGTSSQLVAAGSLPAQAFTELAVAIPLVGDTATPGIQISLQITNITGAATFFRALMIGTALR